MQKTNKTTEYVFAENCAGAVRSFMATVLLFYGMVFLATSILEEWTISKASFVWIQVFLFLAIVLFHVAPLCGKYEAAITHIVHRHRKSHRKCRQRTIICAIIVMQKHSTC